MQLRLGTEKDSLPTTSVVGESTKQAEQSASNGISAPLQIVEGLCYVHPHQRELVACHPVMRGVWHKCVSLLKNGTAMAPLLVDDRPQEGVICTQSVEHLIWTTTNRKYNSLPWLGERVSEASLEARYGLLGCETLDAIYHLEVLGHLSLLMQEWRWIVVHPLSFQKQQCGMLDEFLRRLGINIKIEVVAERLRKSRDTLWTEMRQSILDRFRHYWIGEDGRVCATTHPKYLRKKIVHEPVGADE